MAALKGYGLISIDSALHFPRPHQFEGYKRRNLKWVSPKAAVVPNFHLPMRSLEDKNRTNTEDIRSLKVITAIKTPYLPDGRFDLEAYDELVNTQIIKGAEGVIVGGTTGEGQLMSWDEHIMLIGHTVNCFGARIKVIGNTGSNSTREAIHATEQGFAVGMHAALHINPYYGKTSIEGMTAHFQTVLHMGPTIIYNVPGRTNQDIPPQVIFKLSGNVNLAGVKECVGNDRVEEYTEKGIVVWSGNDDQCHDSRWDHGATGVISVVSNLVPGLVRKLMFEGRDSALNAKLLPLVDWVFQEPNPIGVNTALAQLGVARPVFRLPYVPLPVSKRVEFVKLVEEIGREHFVGERDVQVLDDDDFILIGRSKGDYIDEWSKFLSIREWNKLIFFKNPNNQPPEFQPPSTANVEQDLYETGGISSSCTASTDHYRQDPRPSGDKNGGREHRPHPGYVDSSPYETEFANATAAAHAAAESAERVSFAARAAAELSSKERMRMTMQSSTESPNSSSYDNIRNEPSHRHSSSNVQSGGFAKEEIPRNIYREEEDQSTTRADLSKKNVDEQSENASWMRGHSRDNSLEMRQSDSFAKVGRAKQQPIKDDVNDSCSEDVQLKKHSSLASSSSHTSNVFDDNNIIFDDKRFQSTVEDTERKSHGHDVASVIVTADKSILSVFVLCCLSRLFMDWV
ncbi:hypothetical protein Bca101_037431 [Brassica carinata]